MVRASSNNTRSPMSMSPWLSAVAARNGATRSAIANTSIIFWRSGILLLLFWVCRVVDVDESLAEDDDDLRELISVISSHSIESQLCDWYDWRFNWVVRPSAVQPKSIR
mmetsp:Transcript_23429/g.50748  ORF Transcript_23429/g.50748 Transcript_23429/m.50748 type:complete len:109 (-) Transcript_23429:200-526(-)